MKICGLTLADIGLKFKNTFKYVVCGFGLVFLPLQFLMVLKWPCFLLPELPLLAAGCRKYDGIGSWVFLQALVYNWGCYEFEEIFLDVDGTIWNTTEIVARAWNRAIDEVFPQVPHVTADILKGQFGKTMYVIGNNLFLPSGRQTAAFFLINAASASRMP